MGVCVQSSERVHVLRQWLKETRLCKQLRCPASAKACAGDIKKVHARRPCRGMHGVRILLCAAHYNWLWAAPSCSAAHHLPGLYNLAARIVGGAPQVLRIMSDVVQVKEHFVHAAKLVLQHLVPMRGAIDCYHIVYVA